MRTANIATAGRVVLFVLIGGCVGSCAKGEPRGGGPGNTAGGGPGAGDGGRSTQTRLDPQNAVWSFVLEEALPRETGPKPLEVYVQRRGGKWRQAVAFAPQWNVSPHKVDAAGLKLESDKLTGALAVTLVPDSWVPPEKRELQATFTVDAMLAEGKVKGTFHGEVAGTHTSGRLTGTAEPEGRVDVRNCVVDLRLEGALPQTMDDWMRRVWATVRMVDARPRECTATVSPLSPEDTTGVCDPSGLRLTRDLLGGTLTVSAKAGDNPIAYSYKLAGIVVGGRVGGTFTYRLGEHDHRGTFTGVISSPHSKSGAD